MKAVSAKELILKVVQKFADIGTVYSATWTIGMALTCLIVANK